MSADGPRRRAEGLDALGERDLQILRLLGDVLSVSASQEGLPEACERTLTLGEIRGMAVQAFRGLRLALCLPAQFPLLGLELGLLLSSCAFARLEAREHLLP